MIDQTGSRGSKIEKGTTWRDKGLNRGKEQMSWNVDVNWKDKR